MWTDEINSASYKQKFLEMKAALLQKLERSNCFGWCVLSLGNGCIAGDVIYACTWY
ncbi:hypothetical protein KSZ_78430 [Dictyobacter formicarum]|uniref:Uncharacterized protein n=1 Tax=Dictyobacter formicarum TaxID=2778368 RepID=A0ABQ3VU82_9CHLR|nr:hypothetical protein KSZ_78430 [Dictyobacter formicarum]